MSDIPGDLKFLSSHEWVRVEPDGSVTIGISDHAQDLLGDIVFVELPDIGQSIDAETDAAIVESVKAASDVYSPISGDHQKLESRHQMLLLPTQQLQRLFQRLSIALCLEVLQKQCLPISLEHDR